MADSITRMIRAVKSGDADALAPLWERYSQHLRRIARRVIFQSRLRAADEDDIVATTFQRLWRAAQRGQLDAVQGRESLSRLLSKMTTQGAIDLLRGEQRQCRGGGTVRGDSVFGGDDSTGATGFASVPDDALPPDLVVMAEEETKALMRYLEDDQLASIAVARMEGFSNREIADLLECSSSTVERSVRLIRKKWRRRIDDE